jgi:hypothetical protein
MPFEPPPMFGGDETTTAVRIYCQMMDRLIDRKSPRHVRLHSDAAELLRRIDPQDAIEQLMSEQILWLHARFAHLSYYASLQTKNPPMQIMHNAADRLANTLRRHLMAFADYRNPGRKRFTAVRQANIAHQQIVNNSSPMPEAIFHDPQIPRAIPATKAAALSSNARGASGITQEQRDPSTLAQEHGPAHGNGQEAFEPEPFDPRPVHP